MPELTLILSIGGAAVAVLSALFAGAQAIAARQQADYSLKQLELADRVRKDQAQPYVFVDIRPDDSSEVLLMLIVENTGQTVAHDVRVMFDPPLQSIAFRDKVGDLGVLQEGIPALTPGRRMTWYFDIGFEMFKGEVPLKYTVTVNCSGPFGAVEPLSYQINLEALRNSPARTPSTLKDVVEQLGKVSGALRDISSELHKQRTDSAEG